MSKAYTLEELKLTPEQSQLAAQYTPMMYSLMWSWYKKYSGYGYDAVYDAAVKALIKTARTWDPDKNGAFATILTIATRNEMHRIVRDSNWAKRKADIVSLDREVENDTGMVSYYDLIGKPDKYHFEDVEWLGKAFNALSEREKRLIRLTIVQGMNQKQAGELEGISQMHVSRLVNKGLAKIREYAQVVN